MLYNTCQSCFNIEFEALNSLYSDGAGGDCATDQFSISAPGAFGSPIICGTNSGEHSKSFYDNG